MPDPVTATAITGGLGAAAQGASAAFGGPEGPKQIELPPELEMQQLEIINQQIAMAQQESQRAGFLADSLTQRATVLQGVSEGYIPYSEGANAITNINQQIAERYGQETLDVLGFGQELRQRSEELLAGKEYLDPATERQISETKRLMEEQLTRDLGPDWRLTEGGQRALANFNESASIMRSEARSQEIGRVGQLTNIGSTIGQGIFQGAQFGQSALTSNLANMQNLYTSTAGAATELGGTALQYGQTGFDMLQQFGQQNLSKDITRYIGEGAGGLFPEFQTYGEYKKRTTKDTRKAEDIHHWRDYYGSNNPYTGG